MTMFLREKLERGVLRDTAGDRGDDLGGTAEGDADDDKTVQPGPGETKDSVADLNAKPDDKTDDKTDDKKVADDDKKPADAKAADDKADDKTDDKKDDEITGIPKSRLDAALARARQAEADLRAERQKPAETPPAAATPPAADDDTLTIAQAEDRVSALDVEIAKAMKDDEQTDAMVAVLLREQRELQEGIRDAKLEDSQSDARAQTTEEIHFDRVVDELEQQIPQLDPTHENYDQDLVSETVTLAQALSAQGRTQSDAMLLAVGYMSEKLGINKADVATVKKETDIEKNIELAKKLPPDLTEAKGSASDTAGITKETGQVASMSNEEFAALAEDEDRLKLLRGDMV